MMSDLQRQTAQAIVQIFETSKAVADYGKVTVIVGDSGHLTYGKMQTTLGSGNLFLLIKRYCETPAAVLGDQLRPFLPALRDQDTQLDHNLSLKQLLREAGHDPIMHDVQDAFFDAVYWNPAVQAAEALKIDSALGTTVVFDSVVHGSWNRMRKATDKKHGTTSKLKEKKWVEAYVTTRRDWLAHHSNTVLHLTVYRMDALQTLITDKQWDLPLPLTVRGVLIDEFILQGGQSPHVFDDSERLLFVTSPLLQGNDVKAVQKALNKLGFELTEDGVYGHQTAAAVRRWPDQQGLRPDGIVGPVTSVTLGLD